MVFRPSIRHRGRRVTQGHKKETYVREHQFNPKTRSPPARCPGFSRSGSVQPAIFTSSFASFPECCISHTLHTLHGLHTFKPAKIPTKTINCTLCTLFYEPAFFQTTPQRCPRQPARRTTPHSK